MHLQMRYISHKYFTKSTRHNSFLIESDFSPKKEEEKSRQLPGENPCQSP